MILTKFIRKHVLTMQINLLTPQIKADPFYSSANIKRLEKAIRDAEAGKVTIHELIEDENE